MEAVQHKLVDMQGAEVGSIELDPQAFAAKIKRNLVHDVVRWQLARRRSGTHATLTRSKMKGGNTKPWRQKGTGRARAGSTVSPVWVGGAVAFGPQPRDYDYRLPKRTRKLALASVLTAKRQEDRLVVVDAISIEDGKTKSFVEFLNKVGVNDSAVVIVTEIEEKLGRAVRNLPNVKVLPVAGVNVYDLLRYGSLVCTKDAIEALERRFRGEAEQSEAA